MLCWGVSGSAPPHPPELPLVSACVCDSRCFVPHAVLPPRGGVAGRVGTPRFPRRPLPLRSGERRRGKSGSASRPERGATGKFPGRERGRGAGRAVAAGYGPRGAPGLCFLRSFPFPTSRGLKVCVWVSGGARCSLHPPRPPRVEADVGKGHKAQRKKKKRKIKI